MAMYDWNGNGSRSDMSNNFIEYQIYKDCTCNNNTLRGSANSSSLGGFLMVFIIAVLVAAFNEIFGVLILLGYGWLKLMGM